jgi:hypothetical protein
MSSIAALAASRNNVDEATSVHAAACGPLAKVDLGEKSKLFIVLFPEGVKFV